MLRRRSVFILFLVLLTVLAPLTAYADMGPKASLTVRVEHPPEEPYYLDLLTQEPGEDSNLSPEERDTLNEEMVSALFSKKDEGWSPALAGGTRVPMWGELSGKPQSDGSMLHVFSYVGVPKTYRIILVTQSGDVSVSEAAARNTLQGTVTYDYESGALETPSLVPAYALQFGITFGATLLLEGILLLLYGFSLKENWKLFVLVNLVTQIGLTATVGAVLITQGPLLAYIAQGPAELVIIAAESAIYAKWLKGHNWKRRIGYGIVANIASYAAGFFLMGRLFQFVSRLL